uniref:insulinase family protein n=1 Tax=Vibrio vulnificus TaxID=672 RepID=UPI0019D490CD
IGTVSSETPTVQIEIRLPAGERHVEADKEGLANLTAALIKQDSAIRSVEEIQAQLDKLGSTISLNTGAYSTNVVISSLTKHLPETLQI